METFKLTDMVKGWFVGDFTPTAFNSQACEVAVKHYRAGDQEPEHFHKIATEITVVVSGSVTMKGRVWEAGDIIVLSPGESTSFYAVTDAVNVVVKLPGALNDKYLLSEYTASQEDSPFLPK